MAETPSTPSPPVASSAGDEPRLRSRRHFTRAGLATPVVLSALASKPVLASSARNCTISGQVSGNLSSPGDTDCATLGFSPAYWASEGTTWPDGFEKGGLPNDSCNFSGSDPAGTRFEAAFGARAFTYGTTGSGQSRACTVAAVSAPGYLAGGPSATLLQVLKADSELGRQAVASLLNAHANRLLDPPYPLSPTQVVSIFQEVWATGHYVLNSSVRPWDELQVIQYLQGINGDDGTGG